MNTEERHIERNDLPKTGFSLYAGKMAKSIIVFFLLAVPAVFIAQANYRFFHGMVEILSIFLLSGVFLIALNTYHIARIDYLMFLGICYGFVAGFELLHTISTGNMDILPYNPANLQVKGWVVTGYLEGLSLLLAPLYLHKKINPGMVFSIYLAVSALAMAAIYYWQSWPWSFAAGTVFPHLYKEGNLFIFFILALTIPMLIKNMKQDSRRLLHPMLLFLSLTVVSRFFLLFNSSLTAIIGHLLNLVAAYCLFKIVVSNTLKEPYRELLREKGKLQQYDRQIQNKITEYRREERELQRLSYLDGLTGIPNRRFFDEYFNREWNRALRGASPLSLILCDIDHFKKYNDSYGHLNGDNCLKNVAAALNSSLRRQGDRVVRYGGEEFAVILPETDFEGAVVVAETLRTKVEGLRISSACLDTCRYVTISLGVATLTPNPGSSPEKLIAMADRALYRAKEDGRNRVQKNI